MWFYSSTLAQINCVTAKLLLFGKKQQWPGRIETGREQGEGETDIKGMAKN